MALSVECQSRACRPLLERSWLVSEKRSWSAVASALTPVTWAARTALQAAAARAAPTTIHFLPGAAETSPGGAGARTDCAVCARRAHKSAGGLSLPAVVVIGGSVSLPAAVGEPGRLGHLPPLGEETGQALG